MKRWATGLVMLCLCACYFQTAHHADSSDTPPSDAPAPASGEAVQTLRVQVRSRLERGEPLDALRLLRSQTPEGRTAATFATEYEQSLLLGMRQGQELFAKEDFYLAGKHFRSLLELYPHTLSPAGRIPAQQIAQRLSDCSDGLMAKGLAEYRAGRLEEAIAFWKATLALDPKRHEAKKAIETSTVQLRNLKQRQ